LYQIMEPYHFGKLALATGVFTTIADSPGAWGPQPIHRELGTPLVYWVGHKNVWRYNLTNNTYVPFINRDMKIAGRSSMDQGYIYYVTGYDGTLRPNDVVGIVRVSKPAP